MSDTRIHRGIATAALVGLMSLGPTGGVDPAEAAATTDLAAINLEYLIRSAGDLYDAEAIGVTTGSALPEHMSMADAFTLVANGVAERGILLEGPPPAPTENDLHPVAGEFLLDEVAVVFAAWIGSAGIDCEPNALGGSTNARHGVPHVANDPYPHLAYAESRITNTEDITYLARHAYTTVLGTGTTYSHLGHNTSYAGLGDFACLSISFFGLSIIWNQPATNGVLAYDTPHMYTICRDSWPHVIDPGPPCPL